MRNLFLIIILVLGGLAEAFFVTSVGLDKVRDYIVPLASMNAAIFALVALLQPFFLLLCMVCYLPIVFQGITYEVGVVTLNPVSGGSIALIIICALKKLFIGIDLRLNMTDFFLVGICGTFLVSTFFARSVRDSGFLAFNYIFIPVLLYFCLRILIETLSQYDFLVRCVTLCYTFFGAFVIASYAATGLRAMPMNLQPIGTATVMIFPIFYLMGSKIYPRFIRFPAVLFCAVAIVLTFSRVSLIMILIAPFLFQLLRKGKATLIFALFFVATLGFTFVIVEGMDMFKPNKVFQGEEVQSSVRVTDLEHWKQSIYGRAVLFRDGLNEFYRRPFFGMGLTKGEVTFTQHNFVVEWLQYGGVVGYCLYALFFLSHAWRMSPYARYDVPIRVNLLILFAVLSNAFFNGILHGMMPYVTFATMALSEARVKFTLSPEEHEAQILEAS